MKIATFNINNVNHRLENLLAWLNTSRPDVVALQEIRCRNSEFPHAALARAGYGAIWKGQGPHHGVAMLVRGGEPMETRRALPGDTGDREARYLEAAIDGILICSMYAPNGNPQPGPKFDYKLAWLQRLRDHAAELIALGIPAILIGDFNVVPTDRDIYVSRSWKDNALVQPAPRIAFEAIVAQGWTDTLRTLHPDKPMYTFWHYLRNCWARDAGMRLDHVLVSPSLRTRLLDANVDREMRGAEGASDHAPAWITLT